MTGKVMCDQMTIREGRDAPVFAASKKSSSLLFSIDSTCAVWCQETPEILTIHLKMHFVVKVFSIPITKNVGIATTK
jgi:hypothetical protein